MNKKGQNHIIVIEGYEGYCEFLSDEPEERKSMIGLGLPLEEIAVRLDFRITIFCWDGWYRYELKETLVPTPATRPVSQPDFGNPSTAFKSARIKRIPIPARDPEYWLSFSEKGLSPRSYGLINDGGLLSFASYCLNKELQAFYTKDPFQLAILPMWGGLGYDSQMARATEVPNVVDVPFVVVVTDKSVNRQMANQEGIWTRHAIIRRQMEDVSLALADLALVFGPRGEEIAADGRLPESSSPVCVPRFVEDLLLDKIANMLAQPTNIHNSVEFFLYEPQQAASGVLAALDAATLLANKGVRINRPVIGAGPPMIFAPMKPRSFVDYWSSRGAVRELVREHQWEWKREYPRPDRVFPVRLYPSFFEHLPNVWAELARGSLVLLSPAAAEGLAPGETIPQEVLIQGEPLPEKVADCIEKIIATDIKVLDHIRKELCIRVVKAHRGERRLHLLEETAGALEHLLQSSPKPQDLSRVALMFLDRRTPLRTLVQKDEPPPIPALRPGAKKGTLSVVVTCYEMGVMVKESVESVWASERQPDEVLLIDDGSHGEETLVKIKELEKYASEKGLPLMVIRQRNQGLASARNTGLKAASGEFISFLDSDDMVEPQFYRIALKILEGYPRLGGVAAWAFIFGKDIVDGFWNAPQPEFPFLFIENSVIVPCVTRTELLRDLGGYDIRQRYNYEDWELDIRMLVAGWPIVTVPMHLLKYRVRSDSLYRSMTSIQNQVMRELLLSTHRETVSKFAVEIVMQLENQWKKFVYSDLNPHSRNLDKDSIVYFRKKLLRRARKFVMRLLKD
ncbi:MAG: glycosyltransferase family 2 protein [Planctomycetia bacterium]|nr:glycosyltransferase family 2 protein [Planctomycetia bacterium]